jgi:hypothetical protein
MDKPTTSVCVEYEAKHDWHIFKSDDIYGLYVAHKDARVAYADVKTAIEKLVLLNEGVKCTVEPELAFEEFISSIKSAGHMADDRQQAPITTDRRYTLRLAA